MAASPVCRGKPRLYLLTPDYQRISPIHQKKAEQAAARRAKAAERKAQKAAEKEAPTDSAERSESPRCGSVAKRQLSGAEAPDARLGSCGEAEAPVFVMRYPNRV